MEYLTHIPTNAEIVKMLETFTIRWAHHRLTPNKVVMAALNDPAVTSRLRNPDYQVTLNRVRRLVEWMREYEAEHTTVPELEDELEDLLD